MTETMTATHELSRLADRTGLRCSVDGREGFTVLADRGGWLVVIHDGRAHLPGREGTVPVERVTF